MEYGINIEYIAKTIGIEKTADLLGKAGFKHLDYTPSLCKDWQKNASDAVEIFAENNLAVYQTHAPFYRYRTDSTYTEQQHQKEVFDTLSAASIMGAKYVVVHGDEFDFNNFYTNKTALEYNYEHFAPIVEKAAQLGINIAFENVFEDGLPKKPRLCSRLEDLISLIDKFNSSHVCCCWDFGHASLTYRNNQHKAIELVGNRIRCTHVHDNYFNYDSHLIPFSGNINWQECISALKKYGNTEVLSLELVYGKVLPSFVNEYVKLLSKICIDLVSI